MSELSPVSGGTTVPPSVSHYRLIQKIRSGGMGDVYLAEDLTLPRVVALKLVSESRIGDAVLQQRLMREARAASALSHPNIAQVYEAGRDGDRFYVAMEFVDGESLDRRLERAPFTIDEVITMATQLSSALEEAHAHGVVHRDIKPSNLMLNQNGALKVLDFGLAKFDDSEMRPGDDSTSWKTESGMVMGTAPYMSPEQALGRKADHRSDIFSVGALLYEIVTRRLAFGGSTTADTLYRVVNSQPEAMARFNYDLPLELERIIRKALEKEPERRYQHIKEMTVDLQNLARDRQLGVHRLASGSPRSRRRAAIALAALLATGGVGGWWWKTSRVPPPVRSLAVLPLQNHAGAASAYIVDGLGELLVSDLAQLPGLRVIAPSTSSRYADAKSAIDAGRAMRVDAIVTGSVSRSGDRLIVSADVVDVRSGSRIATTRVDRPAIEITALSEAFSRNVARALRIAEPPPRAAAIDRTVTPEAYELYVTGRREWNKRTDASLHKALDLFRQAIEVEPTFAPAYAGLADSYALLERYASVPTADSRARAMAAAKRAVELDPMLPEARVSLASVHETYEWDWAGAEREYRTAIRLSPSNATAHHWYALLLARAKRFDAALSEIAIARQLDPLSPAIAAAEANIHYFRHDYPASIAAAREALKLAPQLAMARLQLALALAFAGDTNAALAELEPIRAKLPDAAAVDAVIRGRASDRLPAERFLRVAEHRPDATQHAYALAAVRASIGDHDRAVEWLGRAYDARSFWTAYAAVEPMFEALHANPKYTTLMARVQRPAP